MTITPRFKRTVYRSLLTLFWVGMLLLAVTAGLITLLSVETRFSRAPEPPPAQKK